MKSKLRTQLESAVLGNNVRWSDLEAAVEVLYNAFGGGGGGDASAANQLTEIATLEIIANLAVDIRQFILDGVVPDGANVVLGAITGTGIITDLDGTIHDYLRGQIQLLGQKDETAPGSDTATSGLNGRLQRLAQHLSAIRGFTEDTAQIGKAEDIPSASGDYGVPSMAIRKPTPANLSDADADYEMLQMFAGRLWVSAVLTAGTSLIGKVGIDQTTPGTTNAVQLTGPQLGLASSEETADGSVSAGKKYVEFVLSADFTGTLNGIAYVGTADASQFFEAPAGYTLDAIPYTIVTGSIRVHSF